MQPDLKRWERHEILADRTPVLVRPLTPEDGALYPEFVSHITVDDSRMRFFAPLRELSDERIAELTHIDYDRAMAFIAIDERDGHMLGVVRLHLDEARQSGEYAVIVRSALKGHGLGWLLMRRIIEYARAIKLARIEGQVLAENTTMLRMCRELGFEIADSGPTRDIKLVTLTFSDGPSPGRRTD